MPYSKATTPFFPQELFHVRFHFVISNDIKSRKQETKLTHASHFPPAFKAFNLIGQQHTSCSCSSSEPTQ